MFRHWPCCFLHMPELLLAFIYNMNLCQISLLHVYTYACSSVAGNDKRTAAIIPKHFPFSNLKRTNRTFEFVIFQKTQCSHRVNVFEHERGSKLSANSTIAGIWFWDDVIAKQPV